MNRHAFLRLLSVIPLASGCSGENVAEASSNLDLVKFVPVLTAVGARIESGFGEEQTSALNSLAKTTPVGQFQRREFPIVFQGRKTTLRVELKRDDEDALDVWFFTTPELAKVIQQRLIEIAEE